ncbi:MAG: hypothetical protein WC933_02975 [Candidatus Paceibacterota bacterium]|jgi:hypothetical protein
MDMLGTIFGSEARVKIMRLFLFNPEEIFDLDMISDKSKVSHDTAKKEISILEKAKLIKNKSFRKLLKRKINRKIKEVKVSSKGFYLNQDFSYITALKQLLIKTKTLEGGEIVRRLSRAGKLKLVIVAGVFTQDKDSRVDMFVVGNNINKSSLSNVIKSIEAELGRELTYVFFETQDYQYRLGMYDKLVRDVLDYPHQVLLDKISI